MPYFNVQKGMEELSMFKKKHYEEKLAKAEAKKHCSLYFDKEINDFDDCEWTYKSLMKYSELIQFIK